MNRAAKRSEPGGRPLALALVVTMFGGLVAAIATIVDMPLPVVLVAFGLFLCGTPLVSVLAYREARAGEVSVPRAVGRGLKTGLGWLFSLP